MANFWKSAALLFVALRFGDLVNAVSGIWLVPKHVPAEQLGSVLPLVQAANLVATPLAIALAPYSRLLAVHAALGERGKVKAMVQDASLLSGAALLLVLASVPMVLRPVFSRFGIENGNLATAIVVSVAVGHLSGVFTETMRALGRAGVVSLCNAVSAPVRFAVLAVALPIRGLSGYFVGGAAGPAAASAISIGAFAREMRGVAREPYWRLDRRPFFAFALPFAALTVAESVRGMAELLPMAVVPSAESAAWYQITRFTEIASYMGMTLSFLLFPEAAAKGARGEDSRRLLVQTMAYSLLAGLAFSAVLALVGPTLFSKVPFLRPHAAHTWLMLPAGALASVRVAYTCFVVHETGRGQFGFLRWAIAIDALATAVLALVCRGPQVLHLPEWHVWHVLAAMSATAAAQFAFAVGSILRRQSGKTKQ